MDDRTAVFEYLALMGRSFVAEIVSLILKKEAEPGVFFASLTQP